MAFNLFGKKKKETKKPAQKAELKPQETQTTAPEKKASPAPAMQSGTQVLKHMHVSEKSAQGEAAGKYTFIVESSATKPEIAKAVASRYNVDVTDVNIVRLRGKRRRLGRYIGTTKGRKKAIVTLKQGQQIASTV